MAAPMPLLAPVTRARGRVMRVLTWLSSIKHFTPISRCSMGTVTDDQRPSPSPAPADRVVWALRRAELVVQADKERGLRPLGLAPAHYTFLASLQAEPGLTGAELSRRLGVTLRLWPPWSGGSRSERSSNGVRTRGTDTCTSCT